MENKKRIIEIDGLRGLSCFLMFIYHFEAVRVFMLGSSSLFLGTWFDTLFGNYIRVSFLSLVGVCFGLSLLASNRKLNFNRLIQIFVVATAVTGLSYILTPGYTVVIGIIHLIFIASLFLEVISKFKYAKFISLGLVLSTLIVYVFKLHAFSTNIYWLDVLIGFYAPGFSSLDYFPIVPWLVWPLLGFSFSDQFVNILQRLNLSVFKNKYLVLTGKNALLFYVGHLIFISIFWFCVFYLL